MITGRIAAIAVTAGVLLAPAAATTAYAHGPNTNGCSWVPDDGRTSSGTYWNFHEACDQHDLCYTHHPFGDGEAGRLSCDDTFRGNMYYWCDNHHSDNFARRDCRGRADLYYGGVREWGKNHF